MEPSSVLCHRPAPGPSSACQRPPGPGAAQGWIQAPWRCPAALKLTEIWKLPAPRSPAGRKGPGPGSARCGPRAAGKISCGPASTRWTRTTLGHWGVHCGPHAPPPLAFHLVWGALYPQEPIMARQRPVPTEETSTACSAWCKNATQEMVWQYSLGCRRQKTHSPTTSPHSEGSSSTVPGLNVASPSGKCGCLCSSHCCSGASKWE
ncbi:PREDICTED: uncharacterized protein LOC102025981 [Chinchilla lanigera]|uniref:uncharacterized protein LOC102025981 n=1 Tax=Chinchilla lanigera TaxID=34839 RepID=UPI00038ED135|nr:PREDICTED: uncharacterized protein LOC102025981 [Chinchilla lanigera]